MSSVVHVPLHLHARSWFGGKKEEFKSVCAEFEFNLK